MSNTIFYSWQSDLPNSTNRSFIQKALAGAVAKLQDEPSIEGIEVDRDTLGTTGAVEMIAAARVPGHDEQLVACEAEFLEFARRRDHNSLRRVTQHFAKCARADGNQPLPTDGLT